MALLAYDGRDIVALRDVLRVKLEDTVNQSLLVRVLFDRTIPPRG